MKTPSRFENKMLLAFGAALLAAAALMATTWSVVRSAADASRSVAHTHEVLNTIAHARADGLHIELTTQNFLLTGNQAILAERDAAIAARAAVIDRIRHLTSDNPVQQEHWKRLYAIIEQRVDILRQIEDIRKAQGLAVAARFVAAAPLQETRERMYGVLAQMEAEEQHLLARRRAREAQASQWVSIADVLLALTLGALLCGSYAVVRRQFRIIDASRKALAESEEQLAITLRSIGDAVLATDTEGRVVRMNPIAEALTGCSLAEAEGRPAAEVLRLIDEHTRQPAPLPIDKVLATGMAQELPDHILLLAKDGSERPIADSAAPIRNMRGEVAGAVLVFRDETAARQARRLINEQNALLERRVKERTAQLRESEEHLRSVMENVPAMIAYVDARQRYVYANRRYINCFLPGQASIDGCSVSEVIGDKPYGMAAPLIAQALRGEDVAYDWEPFPGVWHSVSYVSRRSAAGEVTGYYVLVTDVSERKRTEDEIRALNANLTRHVEQLEHVTRALRTLGACNRSLLRAANEVDLLNSMCREIIVAGGYRVACVWYRADDAGAPLQPMAQSGYPNGLDALYRIRDAGAGDPNGKTATALAIRNGTRVVVRNVHTDVAYAPWSAEVENYGCCVAAPLRVDGTVVGALVIYSADIDDFSGDEVDLLVEVAEDMSFGIANFRARAEQERIRQAMHRMSFFDELTGLPNEAQFTQTLAAAVHAARANAHGFAVLQANVDRLRQINETLGFANGDALLKLFGERLRAAIPEPAILARLRSDEFAVLLPRGGTEEALTAAQRLEAALAAPFAVAGLAIEVSAKIGIAAFPEHGATVHDLLRHMDIAVDLARKKGVRHAVFDPAGGSAQTNRLVMVAELRHAIEAGHLRLYLQPKVDMLTGKVCGAEGLVRWRHTSRGLISPAEFIGLAEQTTLIKPLTEWAVEEALRLISAWKEAGGMLPVAVNVSASNLRDGSLLEKVRSLRWKLGGASDALEMELTESMLMENPEYMVNVLHKLRAQNIPLYIDDFGTGYSSLSYLQKLPVDYIKIDGSFVADMLVNRDSAAIVRSTIDLAHDLGRKVVAEGVETRAHWDRLVEFGCDIAQGYFIAAPMPPEDFPAWVEQFVPIGGR